MYRSEFVDLLVDEKLFCEFVLELKAELDKRPKNADGLLVSLYAKFLSKDTVDFINECIKAFRKASSAEELVEQGINTDKIETLFNILKVLLMIRCTLGEPYLSKGATYDNELNKRIALIRPIANEIAFVQTDAPCLSNAEAIIKQIALLDTHTHAGKRKRNELIRKAARALPRTYSTQETKAKKILEIAEKHRLVLPNIRQLVKIIS